MAEQINWSNLRTLLDQKGGDETIDYVSTSTKRAEQLPAALSHYIPVQNLVNGTAGLQVSASPQAMPLSVSHEHPSRASSPQVSSSPESARQEDSASATFLHTADYVLHSQLVSSISEHRRDQSPRRVRAETGANQNQNQNRERLASVLRQRRKPSIQTPVQPSRSLSVSSHRFKNSSVSEAPPSRLTKEALDQLDVNFQQDLELISQHDSTTVNQASFVASLLKKIVFETPEYCDLMFLLGSDRVPVFAMKAIMAAASPVLRGLLPPGTAPTGKQHQISIPSGNVRIFKQLVVFCHTGQVALSAENAHALHAMSKHYQITPLASLCESFLMTTLDESNALRQLEESMQTNNLFLRNATLKYVCQNARSLLRPAALLAANVSKETLSLIVQQPFLDGIPEMTLYNAIVAWARQQHVQDPSTDLASFVAPIIPHIRVGLILPSDLIQTVRSDNLIPADVILRAVALHSGEHFETGAWCTPRSQQGGYWLCWDPLVCSPDIDIVGETACTKQGVVRSVYRTVMTVPLSSSANVTLRCVFSGITSTSWAAIGVTSSSETTAKLFDSKHLAGLTSTAGTFGHVLKGSPFELQSDSEMTLSIDTNTRTLRISQKQQGGPAEIIMRTPIGQSRVFCAFAEPEMRLELLSVTVTANIET